MINFFRQIRQGLLSENRISKYLLYAVGEITLVMIGILLALQVDNWNENRNLAKKEITNLKELQKNLKSDLTNQLIPGSEYYKSSVDAYNILQSNFLKAPQSIPEDSIRVLFYAMVIPWKLAFNTVTFDKLSAMGIDLISNDTIRENISQLYGYKYRIIKDYHDVTVTEFREDFVPRLSDHFNVHKPLTKPELDYLKNDKPINTRLTGMVLRRQHLREYFLDVKPLVEQLIADIETEIERREN
jgi:hypothetical protein